MVMKSCADTVSCQLSPEIIYIKMSVTKLGMTTLQQGKMVTCQGQGWWRFHMPISQMMFLEEGNADSLLYECLLCETTERLE